MTEKVAGINPTGLKNDSANTFRGTLLSVFLDVTGAANLKKIPVIGEFDTWIKKADSIYAKGINSHSLLSNLSITRYDKAAFTLMDSLNLPRRSKDKDMLLNNMMRTYSFMEGNAGYYAPLICGSASMFEMHLAIKAKVQNAKKGKAQVTLDTTIQSFLSDYRTKMEQARVYQSNVMDKKYKALKGALYDYKNGWNLQMDAYKEYMSL